MILSAFAFGGIVFGLSSIGEGAEAAMRSLVALDRANMREDR